jgi:hypothetical protein
MNVDFPAPFGPVKPYRRPAENVVVTSSKRTFDPNRMDTPVTEIMIVVRCFRLRAKRYGGPAEAFGEGGRRNSRLGRENWSRSNY